VLARVITRPFDMDINAMDTNETSVGSELSLYDKALHAYRHAYRSLKVMRENYSGDANGLDAIKSAIEAVRKDFEALDSYDGIIPTKFEEKLVSRIDYLSNLHPNDLLIKVLMIIRLLAESNFTPDIPMEKPRRLSTSSNASTSSGYYVVSYQLKPKKLKSVPTSPPAIPLSNRFSPLTNNQNSVNEIPNDDSNKIDSSNSEINNARSPTKEIKIKIDPIWLIKEQTTNWRIIINQLKSELNFNFKMADASKFIKITAGNPTEFKNIRKILDEKNYLYFTSNPKNERPLKAVICGLPSDTPCDLIKQELEKSNFNVIKVVQFRNYVKKTFYNKYLCHLAPGPQNQKIFEIKVITGFSCNVETYKFKGIKQCYRCLYFNHSSENCNLPHRCLKCGEGHSTNTCTKPVTEKPKCANCGEDHLANNRKCPANPLNIKTSRQNSIAARNAANELKLCKKQLPASVNINGTAPLNPIKAKRTYASLLNPPNQNPTPTDFIPRAVTLNKSAKLNEDNGNINNMEKLLKTLKEIESTLKNIQNLCKDLQIVNLNSLFNNLPQMIPNENNCSLSK
jgi:hypothetical protein